MELLQVSPIEGVRFMDLCLGGIRLLQTSAHRTGEAVDGMGKSDERILIIRGRILVVPVIITRVIGVIGAVRTIASMTGFAKAECRGRRSRAEDVEGWVATCKGNWGNLVGKPQ